jgi:hypothetical protein
MSWRQLSVRKDPQCGGPVAKKPDGHTELIAYDEFGWRDHRRSGPRRSVGHDPSMF